MTTQRCQGSTTMRRKKPPSEILMAVMVRQKRHSDALTNWLVSLVWVELGTNLKRCGHDLERQLVLAGDRKADLFYHSAVRGVEYLASVNKPWVIGERCVPGRTAWRSRPS
jgi:hypothetical protein